MNNASTNQVKPGISLRRLEDHSRRTEGRGKVQDGFVGRREDRCSRDETLHQ
jgi:hypothetical protein